MTGAQRTGPAAALAAVLGRVAVTGAEVGPRFPLFADPATGRWTTTGRGSWAGGFWAGLLWLRARYTGDPADREAAVRCTARLEPWAGADTATRGLILWYGTAAAEGDPAAEALRARAARCALAALDPELGLVPWGSALGGPRLQARADAVPGMVPLLAGADVRAAASHLHRHLDLCLGAAGPRPAWGFDAEAGWLPYEEPGAGWSRGRAWLLLAVADALLRSGTGPAWRPDRLAAAVERLLPRVPEGACGFGGPLVPPADEDRPEGPLDTSAAAVTAVALLKLARLPGGRRAGYADRAGEILARLTTAHLTGPGGGRPAGMLLDGCYDAARGTAVRHELVWGDFFLALALASLTGLVDITRV